MAKFSDLPDLDRMFGQVKYFCETGCRAGDAIAVALEREHITAFSCDIRQKAIDQTRRRFPDSDRLMLIHNNSLEFLGWFCRTFGTRPTLFWLDAHWPMHYGSDRRDHALQFPLLQEVEFILANKADVSGDIILCDDLAYISDRDNPFFGIIEDGGTSRSDLSKSMAGRITSEFRLCDLMESLSRTHDLDIINEKESPVLRAMPREKSG